MKRNLSLSLIYRYVKKHVFFISIISVFLFAFLLRFINISNSPVALTHDEMFMALSAKAFTLTGTDMTSSWKPWELVPAQSDVPMGELAGLIDVLPLIFFPLSMFSVKLMPVLMSSFLCIALLAFVYELTKSKRLSIISGILMALNPWSIEFGRTTYEAPVSVSLFLFSMFLLLHLKSIKSIVHRWIIILVVLIFSLFGFYLYFGLKLIFIPVFFITLCYGLFTSTVSECKKLFIPYLLVLVVFSFFFVRSTLRVTSKNERTGELIPFQLATYQSKVNDERRTSLPSPFTEVFVNKYTLAFRDMSNRYLQAYSPSILFLFGETRGAYSLWIHGLFYTVDALFIILGVGYLFKQHKKVGIYLLLLLLIAPLPSALSIAEFSYVFRSSFVFPILVILVSAGWMFVLELLNKQKRAISVFGLISIMSLYAISVVHFLYIYHVRYPVYASEGFFFSERLLSGYIKHASNDRDVLVFTTEPHHVFQSYLFYSNAITKGNIGSIQKQLDHGFQPFYSFGRVTFTNDCKTFEDRLSKDVSILFIIKGDQVESCTKRDGVTASKEMVSLFSKPWINLMEPGYAGVLFRVYNDTVCSSISTRRYVRLNGLKDFSTENMNIQDYCDTWVTIPFDAPKVSP